MISILVGIAIGLAWSFIRYRKVRSYRIDAEAKRKERNPRFRVIGKTIDGRDIGMREDAVYIRDKSGFYWTKVQDADI